MPKPIEVKTAPKAKKAKRRPKTLVLKTLSTNDGAKTRVYQVDVNGASFADDFLYAFKSNVKAARRKSKALRAAKLAAGHAG